MASHRIETYCRELQFPIGALILSKGIDRMVRSGRLDPLPYFRRHARGDWGEVTEEQRHRTAIGCTAGIALRGPP